MTKRPSLKALDPRRAVPPPRSAVAAEAAPTALAAATAAAASDPRAPAQVTKKQPSREGKKVVTVYLSPSVWRDVKLLAAKTDTTIDALMRRGLDMVLAEHGINRGAVEE